MKFACIADTHGTLKHPRGFREYLKVVDGLLIAGDVTDFGGGRAAEEVLASFGVPMDKIMAVSGNCDQLDAVEYMKEMKVSIEGVGRVIGDAGFFGLGGSGATPFNTPNERSEDELEEELERGYGMIKGQKVKVLVSHTPPKGTALDSTSRGVHAGSMALRSFLEANPVDFVLCGHIHEARVSETFGGARMVNPGPLHMGGWAVLDLDGMELMLGGRP